MTSRYVISSKCAVICQHAYMHDHGLKVRYLWITGEKAGKLFTNGKIKLAQMVKGKTTINP
jgi:hypothetical protein